jgi:hypothetical protein
MLKSAHAVRVAFSFGHPESMRSSLTGEQICAAFGSCLESSPSSDSPPSQQWPGTDARGIMDNGIAIRALTPGIRTTDQIMDRAPCDPMAVGADMRPGTSMRRSMTMVHACTGARALRVRCSAADMECAWRTATDQRFATASSIHGRPAERCAGQVAWTATTPGCHLRRARVIDNRWA